MKNPAIILISVSLAIAAFCGVFMWNPPSPRFHPVEREWRMPGEQGGGPAMGWYGRTAVGTLAGAAGGIAAFLVASIANHRKPVRMSPFAIYAIIFVVMAILAATSAGVVYEQRSWFLKIPSPLPTDYEY